MAIRNTSTREGRGPRNAQIARAGTVCIAAIVASVALAADASSFVESARHVVGSSLPRVPMPRSAPCRVLDVAAKIEAVRRNSRPAE